MRWGTQNRKCRSVASATKYCKVVLPTFLPFDYRKRLHIHCYNFLNYFNQKLKYLIIILYLIYILILYIYFCNKFICDNKMVLCWFCFCFSSSPSSYIINLFIYLPIYLYVCFLFVCEKKQRKQKQTLLWVWTKYERDTALIVQWGIRLSPRDIPIKLIFVKPLFQDCREKKAVVYIIMSVGWCI